VRDEVRGFQSDRTALNGFLIARLFLVILLWITQEAIDYTLALLSNGAYSASVFGLARSTEKFETSVTTSGFAIDALFLVFIINIGYRSYRVWNRVNDAKFVTKVDLEIAELNSSIKS
jgi:hypothetical protein